tara:strand:- start:7723 stop:8772 length:1050 start_codon:yes stop_codon:yes gene_type:complete
MSFSQKILQWYAEHKRSLPWRSTNDPYKIWLSEIMLQQTRVAQGMPYYHIFLENFPTITHLANASEQKVLKLWQGLGYYSRARNLHATAKMVAFEMGGQFPNTYSGLLKLKGVGDYTASAIASICFNEPQPVIDGNVFRVLARYFGVTVAINGKQGPAYFKQMAGDVMDAANIRDYNQGIMEFGAIQCTPKTPLCSKCPLNDGCTALAQNKVHELPVKLKKAKVKDRYFNYLVPLSLGRGGNYNTILRQRQDSGIWRHLWEFPLLESDSEINLEGVLEHLSQVLPLTETPEVYLYNEAAIIHKLTHQHLHTKFWIIQVNEPLKDGIPCSELETYAVPVLLAEFIKAFKF